MTTTLGVAGSAGGGGCARRRPSSSRLRRSWIGCVLATPYALDYDLVVLAPVIAFLAIHGLRQGFVPWSSRLLAALWVLPLVSPA